MLKEIPRYHVWVLQIVVLVGVTFVMTTPSSAIEKPATERVSGKIDWVYDYEKGKALSKETGKPMFVVFRCER